MKDNWNTMLIKFSAASCSMKLVIDRYNKAKAEQYQSDNQVSEAKVLPIPNLSRVIPLFKEFWIFSCFNIQRFTKSIHSYNIIISHQTSKTEEKHQLPKLPDINHNLGFYRLQFIKNHV